jgi:hypothetical protein
MPLSRGASEIHPRFADAFSLESLMPFRYKVLDEQHPQFTHLSDLWAAGITILWSVFHVLIDSFAFS